MKKPFIRISEDGGYLTKFDGDTLGALQKAVGGLICTAPVTSSGKIRKGTTAYANDEGLIIGLRHNVRASQLCGYPLVGPVVIRATKNLLDTLRLSLEDIRED